MSIILAMGIPARYAFVAKLLLAVCDATSLYLGIDNRSGFPPLVRSIKTLSVIPALLQSVLMTLKHVFLKHLLLYLCFQRFLRHRRKE